MTTLTNPKDFHNAFPNATEGNDVSEFYVNRSDGAYDCVEVMKQEIDWEDRPGCYLFSGLRGAGKTTELKRLITELNKQDITALYCSADDYLDLNDPEIEQTELVFTAIAGLCSAVKSTLGNDFLKETIWDRTQKLLNSDVNFKSKIKAAGLEVELTLKENPVFKKELIEFSKQSDQFFQEAKSFTNEIINLVKQKTGNQKIVLVVDSLERLSASSGQEQVLFNSLKELFFNYPERLAFDDLTVIYTVPPYLHAVLPNIDQFYSSTFSLPNFKVIQKPSTVNTEILPNSDGISKMLQVIEKRSPNWLNYMSQEVAEHFAFLSGGNVRRLFALIRNVTKKAVLNKADFPINEVDSDVVKQAISEETKNLHWLNAEDRKWLARCKSDNGNMAQHIENIEEDLPPIIRLFDHSLILNYQNGNVWYQVPPIMHDHV